MSFTELLITEAPLAAGYMFTLGALAFGVIPVTPAKVRLARNCFFAGCAIFAGIAIMWGLTTDVAIGYRVLIVGFLCGAAGIGAVETARFITNEQLVKKHEAFRGPTLEATNRSKIDATGASIPGDLPFPLGKADNDSIIDMPGIVVTRKEDGSFLVTPGNNPVERKFPRPTGAFSQLTSEELAAKMLETATELRAFDEVRSASFKAILNKYASQNPETSLPNRTMNADLHAISEQYRSTDDKFAELAQSLAAEAMARIGSIPWSSMSGQTQDGAITVLHAKFAGIQPALDAAVFLEFLAKKLEASDLGKKPR